MKMLKLKQKLMYSGCKTVIALQGLPPKSDSLQTNVGSMLPGDVVKIKQRDKTKSPYSVIKGVDHASKQVNIEPIDAPGNGNRQARRKNYASNKI